MVETPELPATPLSPAAAELANRWDSPDAYRALAVHARDLILVVDRSGVIQYASPSWAQTIGYAATERIGRSTFELLHPDDTLVIRERFARLASNAQPESRDTALVRVRHRDGRWISIEVVGVNLLSHPAVQGLVLTGRDVTERRVLEEQVLAAATREQRRVGIDLHDGLGQVLTGVAFMLGSHIANLRRGQPLDVAQLEQVLEHVHGAIETTRSLARGLSPVTLDAGGIVSALCDLARGARGWCPCSVEFATTITTPLALDATRSDHLYRIAQEALSNAARHACATRIRIGLELDGDELLLRVVDDGNGLPPDADRARVDPAAPGMGLRIMAYRAQTIGAQLSVRRLPGGGTSVECRLKQAA